MVMAQHTKVDSIPTKQSHFRGNSAAAIQRHESAYVRRQAKQAIHTNKQRNRSSKSAVFKQGKSVDVNHAELKPLSATKIDFSISHSRKKNQIGIDQLPRSESTENQRFETTSGEPQPGGPVTHVQMVYKRPELFSGQTGTEDKADSISELSKDGIKMKGNIRAKLSSDDETATSPKSTKLIQDKQGTEDSVSMSNGDGKELKEDVKEMKEDEKQMKEDETARETDMKPEQQENLEKSLDADDGSGEEDELHIPNLLEYDFHAIYKKDGLQFDEKWQDRMLERYTLLKLQKKQRQEAAVNKRISLEQERHFRLLAGQPELLHKYTEPWFADPDVLANYILNSSLLSGEPNPLQTTSPPYINMIDRPHSQLGRPSSSMSSCRSYAKSSDRLTENDTNFRFSIRSKTPESSRFSCTNSHLKNWSRSSTPLQASQGSEANKSLSSHHHLPERPRSSTSIPGRTRYILVKPETKPLSRTRPINPSKLEEQLLRKRFPTQHHTVMKSLGRLDEAQEAMQYWHPEGSIEHKHYNTSRRDKESGLSRNGSSAALSDADFKGFLQGFKNGTDGFCTGRNSSVFAHGKSEVYTKKKTANRSLSRNFTINPLEIVQRQSLLRRNTPRKAPAKSISVK